MNYFLVDGDFLSLKRKRSKKSIEDEDEIAD